MALLRPQNLTHSLGSSFSAYSSSSLEVDSIQQSFSREVLNASSLLGMTGAGLAFRVGRGFSLSLISSGTNSFLRSAVSRLASNVFGFGAEVFSFEAITRGSRVIFERADPALLNSEEFEQGLIHGALSLGSLKISGHLFRMPNILLQHFVQDTAMVTAHQLASRLHFEEKTNQSLAQQYFHAEASLIQMNVGMALVHGALPGLSIVERSFDSSSSALRAYSSPTSSRGNLESIQSFAAPRRNEIVKTGGILSLARRIAEFKDLGIQAESDVVLTEHPDIMNFELSGTLMWEDVTQAPQLVRLSLRPKEGIYPAEAICVERSDRTGLYLRRSSGEIVKMDYYPRSSETFQTGDGFYLQRQRYHEAGVNFRSFFHDISFQYHKAILRAEVSYWLASRDPLVFANFDSLGNRAEGLDNSFERSLIQEIYDHFVELAAPADLLEIILCPDTCEAIRKRILLNPPHVPEAVVCLQQYLREVDASILKKDRDHPKGALEGLYRLTLPKGVGDVFYSPREYWEQVGRIVGPHFHTQLPPLKVEECGERLDLYDRHLLEAAKIAGTEKLNGEVRRCAIVAVLGSFGELIREGNENDRVRSSRQGALAEILKVEERDPMLAWHALHHRRLIEVLIDQEFMRREQVLGRMVKAFEKWDDKIPKNGRTTPGYVQKETAQTWLIQAEVALAQGENPFGDWRSTEGGDVSGLVSFGERANTPLGRFFASYFTDNPREKTIFAKLVARYGEVSTARVEETLEAARVAHEAGGTAHGHAYFALLGGIRDFRATEALCRELEATTTFFGIQLTERKVESTGPLASAEPTLDRNRDYHYEERLVTVLIALHAQGVTLPPEIIRKILVGYARFYFQRSGFWMDLRKVLLALYDLDPVTALTTYHEIEGMPLPWSPGQKLSHRIEGLLAAMSWFGLREKKGPEQLRAEAQSYWTEFFGDISHLARGATTEDRGYRWHLDRWGIASQHLENYLDGVNANDLQAWREYLDQHPDAMVELRKHASEGNSLSIVRLLKALVLGASPVSPDSRPIIQRMAQRILELLNNPS